MRIPFISFLLSIMLSCGVDKQPSQQNETVPTFTTLFNSSNSDSVSCYRIPAMVTALNGDIIVAIDERVPSCGDLKWSEDINIIQKRSTDNGKTWTELEKVIDYPQGRSASDPSMIVDHVTGDVIMFYNYMDHTTEKDIYYLKMVHSSDNGMSWSKPRDITNQITKDSWYKDFKFITSGRGIQTKQGKLVHTLVNLNNGLHLFSSDDHGATWTLLDTPLLPADESKIVELNDGRWMVNCRNNGAGMRHIHVSSNEGITWENHADSTLIDPGCNASIIRYTSTANGDDKNRLLFSNANDATARKNLTVKISYDEGTTWSKGKTIYAGEAAYSTMTILNDDDIGLVFEKDDYKETVFTKFSLEWLTDGKDQLKTKLKRGIQ